ncbi:hypothetical protein [Micromonospora sp. KLBMP9576]|uniref:hypothetical protein n=1 Tax=Micromonospora sp. KLBMP9576 TaxID=3424769 RepID=UPI003D8A4A7D
MTAANLVTALAVGLLVAALGWRVVPRGRGVPVWLILVVGIVAALSGVILARIAGLDLAGSRPWSVGVPAGSAVLGVILVVTTAAPRRVAAPPAATRSGFDPAPPPVADRPDLPWRKTP